jgi:hypothetical protein
MATLARHGILAAPVLDEANMEFYGFVSCLAGGVLRLENNPSTDVESSPPPLHVCMHLRPEVTRHFLLHPISIGELVRNDPPVLEGGLLITRTRPVFNHAGTCDDGWSGGGRM